MTVRVRQLISVVSISPVPPKPPSMSFIQEPTDTIAGQLILPEVQVRISDLGSDSLTISPIEGCSDTQPVTVTASAGIAVFTGLRAGSNLGTCRLQVHNNTRPEIPDIISNEFSILSRPLELMQLIVSGSSGSTDTTSTVILPPFDTTNANVVLQYFAYGFGTAGTASVLNGTTGPAFNSLFGILISAAINHQGQYLPLNPSLTGPNSIFSVFSTSPAPIFPSQVVLAFNRWNQAVPPSPITTNTAENVMSIQLLMPLIIERNGVLITSIAFSLGTDGGTAIPPAGYSMISQPYTPGFNFGTAVAWKSGKLLTENPVWQFPEPANAAMSAVFFQALDQG